MGPSDILTLALKSTEYSDQVLEVGKVTLGETARCKLQKTKRERQKKRLEIVADALLNSGGGVICVEIENQDYSYCRDGIGQDLEFSLNHLVNPSTIECYFKFLQRDGTLWLFVRSWSSARDQTRLCSVDTGLRERSGSSTLSIRANAVVDFLQKKKKCLAQQQEESPAPKRRRSGGIKEAAKQLFERQEVHLGEVLQFGESVNVEFKSFSSSNMFKRLEEIVPKYVSAFANTNGGFIFVGIDDETKKVVGCCRDLDSSTIKTKIEVICRKVSQVHISGCDQRNNWSVEVRVLKVVEDGDSSQVQHVVAIHVPLFCCAVFEHQPECWQIEERSVCQMPTGVWLEKMHPSDQEELCSQFHNILSESAAPPKCKPVYGMKDEHLHNLQKSLFPVNSDRIIIGPDALKEHLFEEYPALQNLVKAESGQGTLILSNSWAVDINRPGNQEVLCEALLVSVHRSPTLYCVVQNATPALWEYCKDVAFHLKQQLVNLGGYKEWVCVIPQLVHRESGQPVQPEWGGLESGPGSLYPDCYKLSNIVEVQALLKALVIVVMSFTSTLSARLGSTFLNLLTREQFQAIQKNFDFENIREVFVHGFPGTGKTIIAQLLMKRILNKLGCKPDNILFVCENAPLCSFIAKQNICKSVTRKTFMESEFPDVHHVIVDEAQNFRVEDGEWYEIVRSISKKKGGVFWVFLDYFQQSHTKPNGLPKLSEQNKIILDKSLRNSVAIYKEVAKITNKIVQCEFAKEQGENMQQHLKTMVTKQSCAHMLEGLFMEVPVSAKNVFSRLIELVRSLLNQGHSPKDIAVLCSTLKEVHNVEKLHELDWEVVRADNIDESAIVLDSIRRFSGLERNIVILVKPVTHSFHRGVLQHFLASAISRACIQLYLLKVQ